MSLGEHLAGARDALNACGNTPPVDNRTTAGNDLITSKRQPPAHIQACVAPAKKWHALESGQ